MKTKEKIKIKFEYYDKVEGAKDYKYCMPFENFPGCGTGTGYYSEGEKPLSYTALRNIEYEGGYLSREGILRVLAPGLLDSHYAEDDEEITNAQNVVLKQLFERRRNVKEELDSIKAQLRISAKQREKLEKEITRRIEEDKKKTLENLKAFVGEIRVYEHLGGYLSISFRSPIDGKDYWCDCGISKEPVVEVGLR